MYSFINYMLKFNILKRTKSNNFFKSNTNFYLLFLEI